MRWRSTLSDTQKLVNAVCGRETTSTARCQRLAGHNHTPLRRASAHANQAHCSPARMFDVYRPLNHSLDSPASTSLSNPGSASTNPSNPCSSCWPKFLTELCSAATVTSFRQPSPLLNDEVWKSPRRPIGGKPLSGSSNDRSGGDFQKQKRGHHPHAGRRRTNHPRRARQQDSERDPSLPPAGLPQDTQRQTVSLPRNLRRSDTG